MRNIKLILLMLIFLIAGCTNYKGKDEIAFKKACELQSKYKKGNANNEALYKETLKSYKNILKNFPRSSYTSQVKENIANLNITKSFYSAFRVKSNFKPGSEPDGFRGIKWGTDIKTLSGMKCLKISSGKRLVKIYLTENEKLYTRKNDDLHIGGAKLRGIEYSFWRGKFSSVCIYYFEGYTNRDALKDACVLKFGGDYLENNHTGYGENSWGRNFVWTGNKSSVKLRFDLVEDYGYLQIESVKIQKQREAYFRQQARQEEKIKEEKLRQQKAYKKEKAREGAEKGF